MSDQVLKKKNWSTKDPTQMNWINAFFWQTLAGPKPHIAVPESKNIPPETFERCRMALLDGNLHGMVMAVFGEYAREVLGTEFTRKVVEDRERTDLHLQELKLTFNPQAGQQIMVIGDAAVRKYYDFIGTHYENPRLIGSLSLWTPTLEGREQMRKLLLGIGYTQLRSESAYCFQKNTQGTIHGVVLHGTLWESSKNWSIDVERAMWDRAVSTCSTDEPLHLDVTDLFIMACRIFAIDTTLGSAICLLDLVTLIEQSAGNLDWERIRQIKNLFPKPYWLWASFIAIDRFERRTNKKIDLPQWVRAEISTVDTFWMDFIESRLSWANPDSKLLDFSRAQNKMVKGI